MRLWLIILFNLNKIFIYYTIIYEKNVLYVVFVIFVPCMYVIFIVHLVNVCGFLFLFLISVYSVNDSLNYFLMKTISSLYLFYVYNFAKEYVSIVLYIQEEIARLCTEIIYVVLP